MAKKTKAAAVVVVPLTAQGHLNQLLHFSRLVAAGYDVPVHFLTTATHLRQATARVQGWDPSSLSNIHFQGFEIGHVSNPQPDPDSKEKFPSQLIPSMKASIVLLREPVYSFVRRISPAVERVVVVYDSMMAHTVQDVSNVANAEAYCFNSISAFSLYSFHWEFAGKPDTLPPEAEVVREVPSREGFFDSDFAEISSLIREAPKFNYGDIYNTSRAIEGFYLDLLAGEKVGGGHDKVWALGPFHPLPPPPPPAELNSSPEERAACLKWLDDQEPDSVVYVAFGSTTSLSDEETKAIARGLEISGHKFLWVLREADRGDVFGSDDYGVSRRDLSLPLGFERRVEGRGLVVREWAPQLEILGHPSTGGFMSHCGWNSCIESITAGVPMAAWPMHSDQPRNAVLVVRVLRVGLQLRDWKKIGDGGGGGDVVTAEEIAEVLRRLMGSEEGDEVRRRAKEVASDVRVSLQVEGNNGVTRSEMESFIEHICRS